MSRISIRKVEAEDENKWLIEGLEVILPEKKNGIGKSIVMEGIHNYK